MSFHVGQKVVCVGVENDPNSFRLIKSPPASAQLPKPGKVYTIRQINRWPDVTIVLVHECNNRHLMVQLRSTYEPGFNAEGFRPLIERKTDISVFTEILRSVKSRDSVPAE